MDRVQLAAGYLVMQGVAGLIWWTLLLADSPVRDWFFPTGGGWPAGRLILAADIVMYAFASIAAGLLVIRQHRFATPVAWMTLGATIYATLVAAGWLAEPIGHWLGLVGMVPSLVLTAWAVTTVAPVGAS